MSPGSQTPCLNQLNCLPTPMGENGFHSSYGRNGQDGREEMLFETHFIGHGLCYEDTGIANPTFLLQSSFLLNVHYSPDGGTDKLMNTDCR